MMLDTLLTFLWANLTPYGTFRAHWDLRDTLPDNNVFLSLLYLDAVHPHLDTLPKLRPLTDSVLKALLSHRPKEDMWRYWVDMPIAPDFDDIALAGLVLPKYGIAVSETVFDTIRSYTDTARSCVVLFKDDLSVRKRRCDCVVNVNLLRLTRDTSVCPFLRACLRSPHSYTYLQPYPFMLYFLSKAEAEGLTCGIDVKGRVEALLSEEPEGMDLILAFAAATNLGLRGEYVERAYRRIASEIQRDGGLPSYAYFKTVRPKGRYFFFGRTLPTIIFLDGVLKYF